jgi:CheY-like chemotaxis protein
MSPLGFQYDNIAINITTRMFQPKPYILLIDDDEDDLEILSSSLQPLGIKIKIFYNGDKAIHFINSITGALPTLIILDYNMPRINGDQVLLLLKSNERTRNIPVIMYSTTLSPIFQNAIIDLGALACFTKPINYLDFTTQVGLFRDIAFSFTPVKVMN